MRSILAFGETALWPWVAPGAAGLRIGRAGKYLGTVLRNGIR